MSAIAPILVHAGLVGDQAVQVVTALTNSATVASDGTMTPMGQDPASPGVFLWADLRGGTFKAAPKLSMNFRGPVKQSDVFRTHAKLWYPVMESNLGPNSQGITPGQTEAYRISCDLQWSSPGRATAADRASALSYLISCLVRQLDANDLSPTATTASPLVEAILYQTGPY